MGTGKGSQVMKEPNTTRRTKKPKTFF